MSQYQPMYDSFQRSAQERYVPASRISVAASVHLPGSDLDPYTGQLKPDRVRRRRTQAKRLEEMRLEEEDRKLKESLKREMQKGGVRVTWLTAVVLCGILLFACAFTIGFQRSVVANCRLEQNQLEEDMKACYERNEALTVELAKAKDISNIGYAARNLGLIRADAVEAVYLTAVDTRPLETVRIVQPAQQMIEVTAQSTQVPVIANAGN